MRACLMLCSLLVVATAQAQTPGRLPVPDDAAVEAARTKIRDVLAGDFKAAKAPESKVKLAERLLGLANDKSDTPANRYAFFVEAREMYVQAGDMLAAFRAVDELAKSFDRPAFAEKIDLVQRVSKQARNAGHHRSIAVVALKLADDAGSAEDYDTAKSCCQTAVTAARSASDPGFQSRTTEQLRRYEEIGKYWEDARIALLVLQKNANDADAHLDVGKYRCLVRRDWPNGISHLQQSSDAELSALAARDAQNPTVATDQLSLANSWWQYAEPSKNKLERASAADRAVFWYDKAIGALGGIDKLAAEKNLEAACEVACGRNFTKLLARTPNGADQNSAVDCKSTTHPVKVKGAFDMRKSWLLSLEMMPPNYDGGWHQVFFWGDGRAGRDPLFVRLDGNVLWGACEDCHQGRGQAVAAAVSPSTAGQWVKVDFIHDVISGEIQLYVNRRLVAREALAISPVPDQKMPVVLGGTDGGQQRFVGQIRNLWLGNIP